MAGGQLRCPWCRRWFRRLRFLQWRPAEGSPPPAVRHEMVCFACLNTQGKPWETAAMWLINETVQ